MRLINKNVSSKSGFRVECQQCKCKKISLHVQYGKWSDETDDYYLICNHCGYKRMIL
ncbi:MAG: hypothetical protein ACRDD7_08905 [Peptostreptococcaceae bacterium]